MNSTGLVSRTEAHVKEVMSKQAPAMAVAHDFKHVDRVRNWALLFGKEEGYPDPIVVEVTALLHDIGLGRISGPEAQREHVVLPPHGPLGAEMAEQFLKASSDLSRETIELIADAIRHHSDAPFAVAEYIKGLGDGGALLKILRDADMTDAMGAVGLMRALTSKSFLPEYDPADIKGPAWGLSTEQFRARFGAGSGRGGTPVKTIIDQANQQIRYYDGLHTSTARRLAAPLVEFMKRFVIQLESEITMPNQAAGVAVDTHVTPS
jgi:HD superfamily phosphodiesterase